MWRTTLTRVPCAISTSRSSPSMALVTLPTMPPVVTTVSPRWIEASIACCCFIRFCWGLKIRSQKMRMSITGSARVSSKPEPSKPPPPAGGASCAKAGVTNIWAPFSSWLVGLSKRRLLPHIGCVSGCGQAPPARKIARNIQLGPLDCKANRVRQNGASLPTKPPEKEAESLSSIALLLERIATSLEAMAPARNETGTGLGQEDAYHWDAAAQRLVPVPRVARVPLDLLRGIDDVRDILLGNTLQFARGFAANNALLWGARGMGKSSLVKAVHAHINSLDEAGLKRLILIEIAREDIEALPRLMRLIAKEDARFIVFCDDLSFDKDETSYKSLKTILDGGLEGRPDNVLFYATSNRRHLMPREMVENERSTAITPGEAVDEKVSLSDRFGLWLGFHNCDQDTYLAMIEGYVTHFGLEIDAESLKAKAIEWSATRGARSGRVAIQFVRHLAGELGKAV